MDLHGADGWCCESMLQANVIGKQRLVCATIAHDEHSGKFIKHRLGDKVFSYARDGALKIPGFPDLKVCGDNVYSFCVSCQHPVNIQQFHVFGRPISRDE